LNTCKRIACGKPNGQKIHYAPPQCHWLLAHDDNAELEIDNKLVGNGIYRRAVGKKY